MDKVFKFVLAFLLIPLVVAFVAVAGQMLLHDVPWGELQWALIGFAAYVFLYPLIRTRNLHFIEIFEHELAHMITDLSVFRRLQEFRVNPEENKSCVAHTPSTGIPGMGCLTTLAPYFLATFTIPLLAVRFITPENLVPALDVVIGVSLGFHFVALFYEFRPRQTDLQKQTMPFAIVITVLLNTILVIVVIGVLLQDFTVVLDYWKSALLEAGTYYTEIFDWLRTQDFAAML